MPEEEEQKKQSPATNPMEEENFPPKSPTRRAVERQMDEPSNVRGPTNPTPSRMKPEPAEAEGEE